MILTAITETYVNGKLSDISAESMSWEEGGKQYHRHVTAPETLKAFRSLGGTERPTYGYTLAGYIVTKLTSISPDKSTKVIRTFRIDREEN